MQSLSSIYTHRHCEYFGARSLQRILLYLTQSMSMDDVQTLSVEYTVNLPSLEYLEAIF